MRKKSHCRNCLQGKNLICFVHRQPKLAVCGPVCVLEDFIHSTLNKINEQVEIRLNKTFLTFYLLLVDVSG